ncbi:MAG: hypothetical protein K8J31_20410, partial [Anaerolineae bacterium]|nr:hypothetical protein [Anaerolineae bacterium]
MRKRTFFPVLSFIGFLVGCQALGAPDVAATLQADNNQIVQEATTIARAARLNREAIAATADAASTQTTEIQQVNLVLLATVRAGDPVTQGVVASTDG